MLTKTTKMTSSIAIATTCPLVYSFLLVVLSTSSSFDVLDVVPKGVSALTRKTGREEDGNYNIFSGAAGGSARGNTPGEQVQVQVEARRGARRGPPAFPIARSVVLARSTSSRSSATISSTTTSSSTTVPPTSSTTPTSTSRTRTSSTTTAAPRTRSLVIDNLPTDEQDDQAFYVVDTHFCSFDEYSGIVL